MTVITVPAHMTHNLITLLKKLFRVLRQCVVFSSRSNIGKDECSAVMDILLTHTLELRIMNAMPVGQTPWADQLE